jgi:hypothetical protein
MRLPLDDNAAVKAIIADGQVLHPDIEVVALAREIEQSSMSFRRIDPKLVTYDTIASGYRRHANTFHDIDDVDYIGTGHVWRGKPKARGSVKPSTRVAHCLGACAPSVIYHPQQTINEGPFPGRLESHQRLTWAESQTHKTARPSGLPHKPRSCQDNSPNAASS